MNTHPLRISLTTQEIDQAPVQNDAVMRVYHSRRPHRKSRAGCKTCRQRRRKCDEDLPKCGHCRKKNITCEYGREPRREITSLKTTTPVSSNPQRSLWPGAYSPSILVADHTKVQHTQHDLFLIHHFTQYAVYPFGSPEATAVYRNPALSLAKERPYLMHAMIALAACHLQHLDMDARSYHLAESFHCQLASRGLCEAVTSINGLKDCDAVLTTAMLLNTLTFCATDYRDRSPPVNHGNRRPHFDWLRVQIGLTVLLSKTSPYHPGSMWLFMFQASESFQITEPPQNNIGEQLAIFCDVDEHSNSGNNPYFDLIQQLTPLVARPPSIAYYLPYFRCVGAMSLRFVDLLEANDMKALLLFAHWLALVCAIDQWWCVRRTRRECWAICEILFERLEDIDLELLVLPAKACDYPLVFHSENHAIGSLAAY